MEPKKIALLVGAVVVALVTALLARQMFVKSAAPAAVATPINFAPAPKGPKVLVATRALPVGTILDDASLKFQPWPKDLIDGAYYLEGKSDMNVLRGSVVRTAITAGQPVTVGSLVQPGDRGFLAAALGPGMRAITVSVRAETSVAGFVFPGDRVDLMLTQTVDGSGGGGGPSLRTTETIIRNLRVLATDQRTTGEDDKGNREVKQFQTVTLEVTPRIGEKIAVAQTIGTLSLSLRPIADTAAELERAIASGAVNVPKDGDTAGEARMRIALAQQPTDAGATFVTGADVSRFQRRSMPAQGPVSTRPVERVAAGSAIKPDGTPTGPTVRIARGNQVTAVPVGGK
jgi:Flp pilus assembly protein CpaB